MVILFSMTNSATTVSVKIPARILERIPAPGNGRSRFVVEALEEKLSRQPSAAWTPRTALGRKYAALLHKGRMERGPAMSEAAWERELAERRGRSF